MSATLDVQRRHIELLRKILPDGLDILVIYRNRNEQLYQPAEVPMIEGVRKKQLTTHPDERGFFREIIRHTDDLFSEGFGQLSHSLMYPGATKAWHIHKKQADWWYVPVGVLKVALHDLRLDSPTAGQTETLFMGEGRDEIVLKIPPGVAHGCKALTTTHLIYVTSSVYDPADEGHIPHDDKKIGYDWVKGPTIT